MSDGFMSFQQQIVQKSQKVAQQRRVDRKKMFDEYLMDTADEGISEYLRMENRIMETPAGLSEETEASEIVAEAFDQKNHVREQYRNVEEDAFNAFYTRATEDTSTDEVVLQTSRVWGIKNRDLPVGELQ